MSVAELAGWIGAIMVLIAYYMVTTGKAEAESKAFQLTNIIGAGFLIYYTYNCEAYASMAVNVIWVLIGMNSFINLIKEGVNMKLKAKFAVVTISFLLLIFTSDIVKAQELEATGLNDQQSSSIEDEVSPPSQKSIKDEDDYDDESDLSDEFED